jgi:hypothetical protein
VVIGVDTDPKIVVGVLDVAKIAPEHPADHRLFAPARNHDRDPRFGLVAARLDIGTHRRAPRTQPAAQAKVEIAEVQEKVVQTAREHPHCEGGEEFG